MAIANRRIQDAGHDPTMRLAMKHGLIAVLALVLCFRARAEPIPWPKAVPAAPPMTTGERANVNEVLNWWRLVIESGHLEYVTAYQARHYIQHDPEISTGRRGFLEAFSVDNEPLIPIPKTLSENILLAAGRGDFVWIMRVKSSPNSEHAGRASYRYAFDVLRLKNRKIQEHWDIGRRKSGDSTVAYGKSLKPPSTYDTGVLSTQERLARDVAFRAAMPFIANQNTSSETRLAGSCSTEHLQTPFGSRSLALDRCTKSAGPLGHPKPVLTLVNGEYVLMMWEWRSPDPDTPSESYPWFSFQLMRVRGGKVTERWQSS